MSRSYAVAASVLWSVEVTGRVQFYARVREERRGVEREKTETGATSF